MMDKVKKGAPLLLAGGIALVIIAAVVIIIKGTEALFGITSGWITVLILSLFMAIEMPKEGIHMKSGLACSAGCAYGIGIGILFSVAIPFFLLGVFVLITCKIAGRFSVVMNDYALCMATVYTISGVSDLNRFGPDLVMYGIGIAIITVICMMASKIKKANKKSE